MTELNTHLIFGALTRPPMFLGVTSDYFALILIISLCSFIGSDNLAYGLLYLPLHSVGWLVCKFDPHFFNLITKKIVLPHTPNKSLWRVKSYAPF